MRKTAKVAAGLLALSLAACSENSSTDTKTEESATESTEVANIADADLNFCQSLDFKKATPPMSEDNVKYLEENKAKDGVQVSETGLQYRVIESGDGATPGAEDFVTVHYSGCLIDGTEFDSSYKRGEPISFPANGVIPGWVEALQMMKVGDKYELTIPSDLAYGDQGAGGVIPPKATLIFQVELLDVKTRAEMEAEAEKALAEFKNEQFTFLDDNATKDGINVTESGLQYRVIEEGTGKSPSATSDVTVHYEGKLITGDVFDSSYKRGSTSSFPLNQVIAGWTEGLQLMKEGGKYEFFIPHHIGYGERGSRTIPPFATLIFTVELVSVDS